MKRNFVYKNKKKIATVLSTMMALQAPVMQLSNINVVSAETNSSVTSLEEEEETTQPQIAVDENPVPNIVAGDKELPALKNGDYSAVSRYTDRITITESTDFFRNNDSKDVKITFSRENESDEFYWMESPSYPKLLPDNRFSHNWGMIRLDNPSIVKKYGEGTDNFLLTIEKTGYKPKYFIILNKNVKNPNGTYIKPSYEEVKNATATDDDNEIINNNNGQLKSFKALDPTFGYNDNYNISINPKDDETFGDNNKKFLEKFKLHFIMDGVDDVLTYKNVSWNEKQEYGNFSASYGLISIKNEEFISKYKGKTFTIKFEAEGFKPRYFSVVDGRLVDSKGSEEDITNNSNPKKDESIQMNSFMPLDKISGYDNDNIRISINPNDDKNFRNSEFLGKFKLHFVMDGKDEVLTYKKIGWSEKSEYGNFSDSYGLVKVDNKEFAQKYNGKTFTIKFEAEGFKTRSFSIVNGELQDSNGTEGEVSNDENSKDKPNIDYSKLPSLPQVSPYKGVRNPYYVDEKTGEIKNKQYIIGGATFSEFPVSFIQDMKVIFDDGTTLTYDENGGDGHFSAEYSTANFVIKDSHILDMYILPDNNFKDHVVRLEKPGYKPRYLLVGGDDLKKQSDEELKVKVKDTSGSFHIQEMDIKVEKKDNETTLITLPSTKWKENFIDGNNIKKYFTRDLNKFSVKIKKTNEYEKNGKTMIYWGGIDGYRITDDALQILVKNENIDDTNFDIIISAQDYNKTIVNVVNGKKTNVKEEKEQEQNNVRKTYNKADNLPAGEYTTSFSATHMLKPGQDSMLTGFFDKNVKVTVDESGHKKILFRNFVMAHVMYDFAIKTNDNWHNTTNGGSRTPIGERAANGDIIQANYELEVDDLTGTHIGAVLVSAMGGKESDIGNFLAYQTVKLEFADELKEGWDGFLRDANIVTNDQILNRYLLAMGLDTDNDGYVSDEEMSKASGKLDFKSSETLNEKISKNDYSKIKDISRFKNFGPAVTEIDLTGNEIQDIPSGIFDKMTSLEKLSLSTNMINTIDKDAFKSLSNLKELNLNNNLIQDVPQGIFSNLNSLEKLYMNENRIDTLNTGVFDGLDNLKYLELTENYIKDVKENSIKLPNLVSLALSSNRLQEIPMDIKNIPNLDVLLLQDNAISNIGDRLDNVGKLRALSLNTNFIKEVPESLLNTNPNLDLQNLNLFENNIATLPNNLLEAIYNKKANSNKILKNNKVALDDERFKSYVDTVKNDFYPQKNEANLKLTFDKSNDTIKWSQDISALDLAHWQFANEVSKKEIDSVDKYKEFKANDLPNYDRDTKAKSVMKEWDFKVLTVLEKKLDGRFVQLYNNTDNLKSDTLAGEFKDELVKDGDEYRLTKYVLFERGSTVVVRLKLSEDIVVNKDKQDYEVYQVPVMLYKAKGDNEPSELSMANDAVEKMAKVQVMEDGKTYLYLSIPGMELKGYSEKVAEGRGRKGHLERAWYYPTREDYIKSLKDAKNESLFKSAEVVEKAEDVIFDSTTKKIFPTIIKLPISQSEMYKYIRVQVDAMRVIEKGDENSNKGIQDAVIKFDWANKKKIDKNSLGNTDGVVNDIDANKGSNSGGSASGSAEPKNEKIDINNLKDGVYTVNIKLMKEYKDEESMGNSAIDNLAVLQVSGKDYKMQISTRPLEYLGQVASIVYMTVEGREASPTGLEKFTLRNESGEYTEERPNGYEFSLSSIKDEYPVVVDPKVDIMGRQNARLIIDWDTIAKSNAEMKSPVSFSVEEKEILAADDTTKETKVKVEMKDTDAVEKGTVLKASIITEKDKEAYNEVKNVVENLEKLIKDKKIEFLNAHEKLKENEKIKSFSDIKTKIEKFKVFDIEIEKDGQEAKIKEGKKVVLSLPIPTDYDAKRLQLIRIDDNKKVDVLRGVVKDGMYVVEVTHFSKYILAQVSKEEVKKEEIKNVEKANVLKAYITGYPDNTFKPNKSVTRAEVAMVISNLIKEDGEEVETSNSFKDVKKGAWYYDAVEHLYSQDMISGKAKNMFAPQDSMTRAELATILVKVYYLTQDDENKKTFSDIKSHWAKENIEILASNGYINGYPNNTFKPNKNVTRSELVTIINNVLGRENSIEDINKMNPNLKLPKDVNEKHWAYANILSATNDLQKNYEDMMKYDEKVKAEVKKEEQKKSNEKVDIANLKDGEYSINIEMFKAIGESEPTEHSMSNNAVNHDTKLIVRDSKATLIVTMKGMALKGFGDKKGHLQKAWYYDTKQDYIKSLKDSENSSLYKPANVLNTFNEVAFESDEIKTFPKDIAIPVKIGENYKYIRAEVDAMKAIGGSGLADAALKINWDSITK